DSFFSRFAPISVRLRPSGGDTPKGLHVVQFKLATLVRVAELGAGAKTRLSKKEDDYSILYRVARLESLDVAVHGFVSPQPHAQPDLTYLQFPGWLLSPRQP
ncbi:MAG: hypothetical protein ACKO0N_03825, partial [Planctomycetota bacterium]